MLIDERVSFSIAESGFISVILMLKDIVVLVVLELDGERIETEGRTVSTIIVCEELAAMLFEVSFTWTLYVYVPSLIDVLFIEQVVPAIDMETFALEPPSFVSSRQLFGLDSVNVKFM